MAETITVSFDDPVNKPSHYNHAGIECIEAIRAALTPEEFRGYIKGNNMKYTWREQYKNGDEDMKKATWYMNYYQEKVINASKSISDT